MGKRLWGHPAPVSSPSKWGRWEPCFHNDDERKPGICISLLGRPDEYYDIAFMWLRTPEGKAEWLKLIELDSKRDKPNLSPQDVEDFKQILRDLEKRGVI